MTHSLSSTRQCLQSIATIRPKRIFRNMSDVHGFLFTIQCRQLKKNSSGRSPQLHQFLSYKPHPSFNPTWIFCTTSCVSFKWYFWETLKKYMLVLGTYNKDRKSTRDKASIGNPKVNRGCSPLTANRTSADCVEIHSDIQYNIFHWQSTILGDSTLCLRLFISLGCCCRNMFWNMDWTWFLGSR